MSGLDRLGLERELNLNIERGVVNDETYIRELLIDCKDRMGEMESLLGQSMAWMEAQSENMQTPIQKSLCADIRKSLGHVVNSGNNLL